MIDFGIIHKIGRETIDKTIASIAAASGMSPIAVFPDDGRFGAFKNFHRALHYLAHKHNENRWLCVVQDDMLFHPKAVKLWQKGFDEYPGCNGPGVWELFTSAQDIPHDKREQKGWIQIETNWNSWGGSHVIHKGLAQKIIEHEFYQNHLHTYEKNQQMDGCMGEVLRLLEIPVFVHNPSLNEHIGLESTIGHGELTSDRKGFNYQLWEQ